jgi:hypothetical protein
MKKLFTSAAAVISSIVMFSGVASALGQYTSGSTGVDESWPNCTTSVPTVSFGIVGVSDGTGYTTNPCLSQESSHFLSNLSLYANTGWYNKSSYVNPISPKVCASGDNNCLAYNYGYNAGLYAYNAANKAGVYSSTWWLDVETNNTWNSDVIQNQNSLQGEHDGLIANGITTVGVYSTTAQWQTLTGSWKNNWPNWGATTWNTATQAKTYCTGHQFTGGPSYLMQYKAKRQLDQNVAC